MKDTGRADFQRSQAKLLAARTSTNTDEKAPERVPGAESAPETAGVVSEATNERGGCL